LLQYLKRLAITFVAMSVVSGIADAISETDVATVNAEVADAIQKFNFPAVIRSAWDSLSDSFYDNGAPVLVTPVTDTGVLKSPEPTLPTDDLTADIIRHPPPHYTYPNRHFSWQRLLLSPFGAYAGVISTLSKAWTESIISFVATLLALIVGFCLAAAAICSLSHDDKLTTLGFLLALWLAPFAGGLFMWGLQFVILVPFLLFGKVLKALPAVMTISTTVPLLHGAIQSTIKAEREHALAEKIEKYVEKKPAERV
jgi:hypothetical protein